MGVSQNKNSSRGLTLLQRQILIILAETEEWLSVDEVASLVGGSKPMTRYNTSTFLERGWLKVRSGVLPWRYRATRKLRKIYEELQEEEKDLDG